MSGNLAIGLLGKADVVLCRNRVVFVNPGIARVGENLIDASSEHDVATQEHPYWPPRPSIS